MSVARSLLTLALLASACAAEGKQVTIVEADAGSVRQVAVGDTVSVRLQAQPGTGYGWSLVPAPGVRQAGDPVESGAGVPGGVETVTFALKVTAPGTHVARFVYGQPWPGGDKAARSFEVTLAAK